MSSKLSFLEGETLRDAYRKSGYIVRLFDPRGQYPQGRIASRDTLYSADDQLVFTVVYGSRWDWHASDAPYTEMDWVTPQELRFLASILLCEDQEGPLIRFYPVYHFAPRLSAESLDLSVPEVSIEIKNLLIQNSKKVDHFGQISPVNGCLKKKTP